MQGSHREPLLGSGHVCTALSLIVLSCSALAPGRVAAVEVDTADAVEPVITAIIVTARKRPQVLESVPASIYAVNTPMLAATATRNLIDLAGQVAGMVFSRAPDEGLALTLRGVGTPARSHAFDQSIALFLDGTFLAKGQLYPLALFDIERVEVWRGPHSTEVGKNASVGALSVVSREPGATNALDAEGSWDVERGGYALGGGADIQLGADSALRLAGTHFDRHGWVSNGATGNDVPEDRDSGVRLTLRTSPRERLSGVLRFQYGDHERLGTATQLVSPPGPVPPAAGDSTLDDHSFAFTPRGPEGESHHETRAHIASAHFEFGAGSRRLVSETAWVDFDASTLDDIDFSASANVDFLRDETFRQFSQELRVATPPGERLEYLAGVFYLRSSWDSIETQYWNVPGFPPETPGQLFNGPFTNDFTQDTQSAAVFANGTWRATQRVQLSAGLRLTDERKDVVYGRFSTAPLTLWNTMINPPFARTPLEFDGRFLDGNLAAQFELSEQTTLYASYGRGNKLGGFVETTSVPNADPARDARIETETTTSWELGARFRALEDHFRAGATLFYMDIADFQDTTFDGTAFVTTNLPARSKGVELEASWITLQGIDARLAVTWADATEIIDGRALQLTQAPRWSSVASFVYSHGLAPAVRGSIGIDLLYRDVMFNQRGELFPSSSFAPLGLRVGVEDAAGRWGIALIGRNVTNRVSAEIAGPTPDPSEPPAASPEALRSVLLSAWFRR